MLSSLLPEMMLNSVQQALVEATKISSSSNHILSYPSHGAFSHMCQNFLFPPPFPLCPSITSSGTQLHLYGLHAVISGMLFLPNSSLSSISDPGFPSASFLFVLLHLLGIISKILQIPSGGYQR